MTIWASWLHKWLALLMAVQILFWFVSGAFFAIAPIETVRSEHVVSEDAVPDLDSAQVAPLIAQIAPTLPDRLTGMQVATVLGKPALTVTSDGSVSTYDLETGQLISPISAATATRIAERHLAGNQTALGTTKVTDGSTEYRGALPAWRVDFEQAGRSVYVAADTAQVTARRSDLWRTFDLLWGLHIMDWNERDDFNHWLLIAASVLGLVIAVSGIVLLPERLGYSRWRARRRRS